MPDYGLVSIIMPTWGCAAYIAESIASVQAQSYPNWELLIQDDCSTDNTPEVVRPYMEKDPRIKYACNTQNSGAAITRNNALRRARGRIKDVRKNNDTALWLKVVRKAPCHLLKENLARYRRRKVSITPKPLWKRIWAHYPLFHVAEGMDPLLASFWTLMNVVGNGWKKMWYVKRYE